jgi:hypothetical protein
MTSLPSFENGFSFLLVSDFDQTLNFNDSGYVLCSLVGIRGFEKRLLGWPSQTWFIKVPNSLTYSDMILSFAPSVVSTYARSTSESASKMI